jgi:hypothetical protein
MAGLSRSGGALRICSYISAEGCTSAGWKAASGQQVRRAKITFAAEFVKEQKLVSMTQVQIYETGKVSISGNCVQAKAR